MADAFSCRVITPEARLLDEKVRSVVLPMWDGSMGFLPGRAPIVGKLGVGELRLDFEAGGSRSFLIDRGFAQMVDNKLTVLAQAATPAEEIDQREAEAELAEAQARTATDPEEMDRIAHERQRARAKIGLAKQFKGRGGGI